MLNEFSQINHFAKINLSISIGFSIYATDVIGHFHIRQFYFIPFIITLLSRIIKFKNLNWRLISICIILSFLSPTWWVVVSIYLLIFYGIIQGLLKQFHTLLRVLVTLIAIITGQIFPALISYNYILTDAPAMRGNWDSNIYGGHLVDFITSSPILNRYLGLEAVKVGGSAESNMIGTFGMILTLYVAVLILINFLGGRNRGNLLIPTLFLATALFFINGGLVNLISGLTQIIGFTNPARAWSRVIIVLFLLGVIYFCQIHTITRNKILISLISISAVILTYLDNRIIDRPLVMSISSYEEKEMVEHVKNNNLSGCAVLQIPADSFPVNKISTARGDDVQLFHYRGFVPYIIDPETKWSFGSATPDSKYAGLFFEGITPNIQSIKASGFCFILWDKKADEVAKVRGLRLTGGWEGLGIEKILENSRFKLYEIKR